MKDIGNTSRITLSINPFIPKPLTPFQWMAMTDKKVVEKRLAFLKKALKDKQIELLIEPLRSAYIQGVLSRGTAAWDSFWRKPVSMAASKAGSGRRRNFILISTDFYMTSGPSMPSCLGIRSIPGWYRRI